MNAMTTPVDVLVQKINVNICNIAINNIAVQAVNTPATAIFNGGFKYKVRQ
jgi:hypothetical protein